MTKEQMQKVLQKLSEQFYKVLGNALDKVILYGSYARGDYNLYSDVDIMVLVDLDEQSLRSLKKKLNVICSRVGLQYDLLLSLVIKNKQAFYRDINVLPFYQNVVKDGVVIYAA